MTENRFRAVVLLSVVAAFISATIVLFAAPNLPAELQSFVDSQSRRKWTTIDRTIVFLGFVVLIASVALLFFARWSRLVFTAGIIASLLFSLFGGPTVLTSVELFVYDLTLLLDGVIVALMYFSDVRFRFERQ